MDLKLINRQLRKIIREELGLNEHQIRPANNDSPTDYPDDEQLFGTVLLKDVTPTGWDDYSLVNSIGNQVKETVAGVRLINASIQLFREGAYWKLNTLRSLLQMESAASKFKTSGFGFVRSSKVILVPQVQNTYWEEQAQMDLYFYIISKEEAQLDTYGTFPLEITVESILTISEVIEP
jgi:hypothetical protein